MTTPLTSQRCIPCEAGTPPLSSDRAKALYAELPPGWALTETSLQKRFTFKTFPEAIAFVNRIAELAEREGHHPDLDIRYRRVTITLTTHAIKGLSPNDFILAAKIEPLAQTVEA